MAIVLNIHSHYETLMVMRNASPEVIRGAYKALSQRWHPDKNDAADAAQNMAEINAAYDVLSDPEKRFHYDQWLEAEEYKWMLKHPRPIYYPDEEEPAAPAAPPKRRRGTAFEIDEVKANPVFAELDKRQKWKLSPLQKRILWMLVLGGILGH